MQPKHLTTYNNLQQLMGKIFNPSSAQPLPSLLPHMPNSKKNTLPLHPYLTKTPMMPP